MNIEYAIPCRFVEANGGLGTIVGAGIDTWVVPALPTPVGVMIAIRAVGEPAEVAGTTHHLHCHVEAPGGSTVGDALEVDFPVEAPDARQDWLLGVFIPAGVQWIAEEAGTYTVYVKVDDSEFPIPMHVVLAGDA